ncbi:hypothetical protein T459_22684 [Capsicum annuum]|uniref:Uncharacterized protein n=1 Tax=Capsicum annuum TaxID=4072 RepID=A0A2G2YQ86_CAPAN|nr:hypothetical protein T459_22684 [Capsicum annuum]
MEETLPGKLHDDIINHYNIFIDNVEPSNSGRSQLSDYLEVHSDSNQNSRGRMAKRGFLDRIETQGASHAQKYFKHLKVFPKAKRGESILDIISADAEAAGTSQVVLSTKNESTLPQESINAEVAEGESAGHGSLVASHAQKYFKHLKSVPKAKRRETILDIISAYAEATGTTDVVLSTKNERTLPQESINAEQTITVAEGDSAGYGSLVS